MITGNNVRITAKIEKYDSNQGIIYLFPEEDIKLQFITPAIECAGWDKHKQIKLEHNFTDGRVIVYNHVNGA